MTEELETNDSLNVEETLDSNQETEGEDLEAKLSKAEEIAKNQRIRAERAESELKALKKPTAKVETETPKNEMSLKDIRALQDVHDDDVEEITEFAKFKGISVVEAKKHTVMQTLLKTRAEERASAEAANTASNKRSVNHVTDEDLLNDFEKGKVSSDDGDIEKLVKAQLARKKQIAKGN